MLDAEVHEAASHPECNDGVATAPGGHHLQASRWGDVKAGTGWPARRILLRQDGTLVGGCQLLVRSVPVVAALAYVQRGPS